MPTTSYTVLRNTLFSSWTLQGSGATVIYLLSSWTLWGLGATVTFSSWTLRGSGATVTGSSWTLRDSGATVTCFSTVLQLTYYFYTIIVGGRYSGATVCVVLRGDVLSLCPSRVMAPWGVLVG